MEPPPRPRRPDPGMSARWLLTWILSISAAAADPPGRLSGTVVDPIGAGVPDAEVVLESQGGTAAQVTRSDPDGRFSFPAVVPSVYKVVASIRGFETKTLLNIWVHPGEATTITVELKVSVNNRCECPALPPPPPLRVAFAKSASGHSQLEGKVDPTFVLDPLSPSDAGFDRVTVSLYPVGNTIATVKAGPGGVFRFLELPPGEYWIVAKAPGFFTASFGPVKVREGQKTTVLERLELRRCAFDSSVCMDTGPACICL